MFTVLFSSSTTEQVPQTTMSKPTKAKITQDAIAKTLIAEAPIAKAPIASKGQITLFLKSKIRSLHTIALWPFRRIAVSGHLPLNRVFSVSAWSGSTP